MAVMEGAAAGAWTGPLRSLTEQDPGHYSRHMLHAEDRVWVEKNCYVDIWLELVHSLRLDPMAMLPFTLAVDFEGDQFTFFKPSHDELRELYGIDVQELTVWRSLLEHAQEHLGNGKLISTEADAFYLPDTSGTDYQRQHTKSTIVLQAIDVAGERLRYFHNAGYFELGGADFRALFRKGMPHEPTFMPLFAELVRIDRITTRSPSQLRKMATALIAKYLGRRPTQNPLMRFRERFERDLPQIQQAGLAYYHIWAFASVRQLGAAFELGSLLLRWLERPQLVPAEAAFLQIANTAKAFILKAARAVNAKRSFDAAPMMAEMATAWDRGMSVLAEMES